MVGSAQILGFEVVLGMSHKLWVIISSQHNIHVIENEIVPANESNLNIG